MMASQKAHRCGERALAPCVEKLMTLARNAESGPQQAWPAEAGAGTDWVAGGEAWQPRRGRRAWADRHRWDDWRAEAGGQRDGWAQQDWQPSGQRPWEEQWEGAGERAAGGRPAGGGEAEGRRGPEESEEWSWDDYIVAKGSTIRVELSGAELGDADLASLVRHLDCLMLQHAERAGGRYVLNVDLSCNLYISDDGVEEHLAPFLERWPHCLRLKLYKTSIGDGALAALSGWAAGGYAHELHFSDLGGQVTGDGVFQFLSEVHRRGRYPYRSAEGDWCSLWLRLEHNAVPNTDKLVGRALAQGMSVSVLKKVDLGQVRPGSSGCPCARDVPSVNLVLFHKQELRVSRQWIGSMVPMAPVPPELQAVYGSCGGGAEPPGDGRPPPGSDYWAQFLGPSQRARAPPGAAACGPVAAACAEAPGAEVEADALRRAFSTVLACPTSGDEKVLGRWHRHLRDTSSPEREAHRILRMTAKLCDAGYMESSTSESSRALSSAATLSDATSSGSSPDPVILDTPIQFSGKPGGEDSTDEHVAPLPAGPPMPPPTCALVAAACA